MLSPKILVAAYIGSVAAISIAADTAGISAEAVTTFQNDREYVYGYSASLLAGSEDYVSFSVSTLSLDTAVVSFKQITSLTYP
jgi:hypothetical protein